MANKIREQFEILKETDRLRRELVTNVSHDLRTPLASMHGYVETLLIKNEALTAEERLHYLEITQEFELEAQQKNITIEVQGGPDNSMVYADIGLMQRVLENLIRNALKFTPRGGEININLDRKPGCVGVAVADTGCGIAESDLERVFDRFYRTDQGEESGSGSTGLGLAIVRKILDLHGSRITVSSVLNEGTCFEFDLPTRQAA